jgi:hypothetical protein
MERQCQGQSALTQQARRAIASAAVEGFGGLGIDRTQIDLIERMISTTAP